MRALVLIAVAVALPASAQEKAMSDEQRADYQKLMRGYVATFRHLGRSQQCGLNFESESFFREVARRHGEDSEAMRIARLSFEAAAENRVLDRAIDPAPPAPMPCDVVALMRGGVTLPEAP